MSQRERTPGVESVGDKLAALLDAICRFLILGGALAALVGVAGLIYTFSASGNAAGAVLTQAQQNVSLFGLVTVCGFVAVALSMAYVHWGEEVLGPLLLIGCAAFFFAPMYLPSMMGSQTPSKVGAEALTALQTASIPVGVIGLCVIVGDALARTKTRVKEGSKSEQLKYGKGLKEEKDIRNVFMGKCWQLPYCRKFVRERCPIYHARRSCWKERVGCMCEESVIRNAMEGRIIPSDAVAAAKYIPQNTKLTADQKAERCRSCVIYNEHQKHKYKLAMPTAMAATAGIYVLFHEPLANGVQGAMVGINKFVNRATLDPNHQTNSTDLKRNGMGSGDVAFNEVILIALLVVGLAYVIRFIEYMLFKAKM